MATSSEYYRTASTPSHYQAFPTPHYEHLYASATTAWQEPANDSYAGPSPAPYIHYAQGAPSGDYVNSTAPQQSTLPPWPASSYAPIQHAAHVVSDSANPEGFASRSTAPYGDAEGQPLPQPSTGPVRQHQNASNPIHEVHIVSPGDTFRPPDRNPDLRISSEIPAQPVDPPVPSHPQNSHTIPRVLYPRSQTAPIPPHPSQMPLQPPLAWDTGPDVPAPIEQQQQHSSHPSDSIVAVSQHNASSPPWPVFHAGGGTFVPPVYERVADVDQQWALVPAQPNNNGEYTHHSVPLDQVTDPATAFQAGRRVSTKKKAAKVPSSYVERQEKLKVSRRKGPLAEDKREKTHFMRKNKRICVRCRFYKSGCDDGDPCQKCDKIEGHARSFREPCYREHLEDTSLVRRCNGRFNQEEAEFLGYDWIQGSKLYEMEIIWNLPGFGLLSMHPMRITFRQYFPKRAVLDTATSVWRNTEGEVKAVEQPPYAIYDTASLMPAFERYFSSLQPDIERWIFERVRHDEIAFLTYQEVSRIRGLKQSKLLDLAMRLQCLSVVSQGYGSVLSNNIPGIREYDYRKLGRSSYEAYDRNSRDRPLPGAINHQMDVAALKYLKKLEKICVKELAGLIFKPKIKPWYELFLAFYVIFWNLEYIHRGAERYILSKNGTLIENSVSNVVSNQIKKWDFAFPVLLYHWRCTLRGYSPFRLARDNPDELRERGHIDAEGFQYVTKVAGIFDRTEADRYPPPLTGFPATHNCMSSEWIVKLFKEAGA